MWPFKTKNVKVPVQVEEKTIPTIVDTAKQTIGSITIPVEEEKIIPAVQLWRVTWVSFSESSYSAEKHYETQIFLSPGDAVAFVQAIRRAYKLLNIKHTKEVKVEEYIMDNERK